MAATKPRPHHRAVREADGYVRIRYTGLGRRGQPPPRVADAMDVRLAISELGGALRMLEADTATLDTRAGRELYESALSKIVLGIRLCASVTRRRARLRRASKSPRRCA